MSTPVRVAIITGGGSGIGKRTAFALLAEGYSVAIAGRRVERFSHLQETVTEAGDAGSRMLAVPTDVTDPAAIRNLFAKTVEAFLRSGDKVDSLLFNNAGVGAPGVPMEELIAGRRVELGTVANSRGHEPDRLLSVYTGSDKNHEESKSAGWTHHQ